VVNLTFQVSDLLHDQPALLQEFISLLPTLGYDNNIRTFLTISPNSNEVDFVLIVIESNGKIHPVSVSARSDVPRVKTTEDLRKILETSSKPWEILMEMLPPRWISSVMELLRIVGVICNIQIINLKIFFRSSRIQILVIGTILHVRSAFTI